MQFFSVFAAIAPKWTRKIGIRTVKLTASSLANTLGYPKNHRTLLLVSVIPDDKFATSNVLLSQIIPSLKFLLIT